MFWSDHKPIVSRRMTTNDSMAPGPELQFLFFYTAALVRNHQTRGDWHGNIYFLNCSGLKMILKEGKQATDQSNSILPGTSGKSSGEHLARPRDEIPKTSVTGK